MAKIIGNTTATPNPRPDWNQTDETKADYIKNKPEGLVTEQYVTDAITNIMTESIVIGEGEATELSIAGGTTDMDLIKSVLGSGYAELINDYGGSMDNIPADVLNLLLEAAEADYTAEELKKLIKILPSKADGVTSIAYGTSNASYGPASMSFGYNNIVGAKGYYIGNIDYGGGEARYAATLTNSQENDTLASNPDFTLDWEVEDRVWFIWRGKSYLSSIYTIAHNNIANAIELYGEYPPMGDLTLKELTIPLGKTYNITDPTEGLIINLDKPQSGVVSMGYSAIGIGALNNVFGNSSMGIGYKNSIFGDFAIAFGQENTASEAAFAGGILSKATGSGSVAIGYNNTASGAYSVAIGDGNIAEGNDSFATGYQTKALGALSVAEGKASIANGEASHAEGVSTKSNGYAAHAEGQITIASGSSSHAEGYGAQATGPVSHAEGNNTVASGDRSHAEGEATNASGTVSHAEGVRTEASATAAHAEGYETTASGEKSHAEGYETTASKEGAHAEGHLTIASGQYSHAEGEGTEATASRSHAEGSYSYATGKVAHAEGAQTQATGLAAHSEGYSTIASGRSSHAEGEGTEAAAERSHAEGYESRVIVNTETSYDGKYGHAEGRATVVGATAGHAEGAYTEVYGKYGHAGGVSSWVDAGADNAFVHGDNAVIKEGAKRSVAFGSHTEANYPDQFVIGRYNDSSNPDTAFAIGNGTGSQRSNTFEVRKNGTAILGGNPVATETYVDKLVSAHNKRITNLEHRLDNTVFTTDESDTLIKIIPEDTAPSAEIAKIGGMSYKSNNLLDMSNCIVNEDTTTMVVGDGTLTIAGYAVQNTTTNLTAGKTYTFKANSTRTGEYGGGVSIRCYDSSWAIVYETYRKNTLNPMVTFTVPEGATRTRFYFYGGETDTATSATYTDVMLNEGDTALPHELYFDGLRLAKVTEIRSTNENLLKPFNIEPVTQNGITMQYLEDEDCFVFNGRIVGPTSPTGSGWFDSFAKFEAPYRLEAGYGKDIELALFKVSGDWYADYDSSGEQRGECEFDLAVTDGFSESEGGFSLTTGGSALDTVSGMTNGVLDVYFCVSVIYGTIIFDNYKVRAHICNFQSGEPGRYYQPKYVGAHNPNLDSLAIPAEVQALEDYGKTDTYIEWRDDGRYIVTPDGETDISDILPDDNFLRVKRHGRIMVESEFGLAVPVTVNYQHTGGTQ